MPRGGEALFRIRRVTGRSYAEIQRCIRNGVAFSALLSAFRVFG
jgi:hypothetical protein